MSRFLIKKTLFAVSVLLYTLLCFSSVYALPGVKDFLPTESGQYVYYRDMTFTKLVYIGFLQYDEGNYAIRYYAPEAESGSKEITLFFTIDTEKDYVLMTGEKIQQNLLPEDAPTVNYLHELFYEFTDQRKKISPDKLAGPAVRSVVANREEQNTDIRILGGKVRITYDYLIPLFNILNIKTKDDNPLFTAVTMGQLLSSADTAFSDFKEIPQSSKKPYFDIRADDLIGAGITGKIDKKSTISKKKAEPGLPSAAEIEAMDAEYKAIADNLGFWRSDALMYTDIIETPPDFFKDKPYRLSHLLTRSLSFGSDGSYMDAQSLSVSENGDFSVLVNQSYDNKTERFYINIRVIGEKHCGVASVTGFSADIDYFNKHKAYFIKKIREVSQVEFKHSSL